MQIVSTGRQRLGSRKIIQGEIRSFAGAQDDKRASRMTKGIQDDKRRSG